MQPSRNTLFDCCVVQAVVRVTGRLLVKPTPNGQHLAGGGLNEIFSFFLLILVGNEYTPVAQAISEKFKLLPGLKFSQRSAQALENSVFFSTSLFPTLCHCTSWA